VESANSSHGQLVTRSSHHQSTHHIVILSHGQLVTMGVNPARRGIISPEIGVGTLTQIVPPDFVMFHNL